MGKGFKSSKPDIIREAEKLKEKLKVTGIVYDLKTVPTTKYEVEVKPTVKYEVEKKKTTLWETIKKTCIQWITEVKYCTQWITEVKKCIKWETEVKPTIKYEVKTEPTTKYEVKVEPTTKYILKKEEVNIEKIIQDTLNKLIDKNAISVPRPKFHEVNINVFKLEITCPHCKEKFYLGGMKK